MPSFVNFKMEQHLSQPAGRGAGGGLSHYKQSDEFQNWKPMKLLENEMEMIDIRAKPLKMFDITFELP